ncbi:MAG TPA: hypothetical protein VF459_15995 [Caulobacteraceae bacterium]
MTRKAVTFLLCAGALTILSGCVTPSRMSPDFGQAVNQDTMAQVADPDAHYAGAPAPASDGQRADLAHERYLKNQVIQPAATSTSTATAGGGGGGGGGSAPTQ